MTQQNEDKLVILHEDNHIIVVMKPQNLASCPDESGDDNLLDRIREYVKTTYDKPGNVYIGLVHRLDRPTGGVMVFAKTSKAAGRLGEQMKTGDFEKKYLAVLNGTPNPESGTLVNYLKKNTVNNMVYLCTQATDGAKMASLEYSVLEEGLSGRTTVFDDPLFPALNGLAHLPAIAMSHAPIDLLVVMLGTNDCKERFSVNSQNIADGLRRLVNEAKRMDIWRDEPKILIIAPMIIDKAVYQVPRIGQEMGERCAEKSRQLPALMRETARETGSWFMDCNPFVRPGPADWMHFDADSNPTFARALASMVKKQ